MVKQEAKSLLGQTWEGKSFLFFLKSNFSSLNFFLLAKVVVLG